MNKKYLSFLMIPVITACHSLSPLKSEKKLRKPSQVIDSTYLQAQADWHYIKGELQSQEQHPDKAINSFKEVLIYSTDSFYLHSRLLDAYLQAGEYLQAFKQCNTLLKKYPHRLELHLKQAEIYQRNHLYKKALAKYQWVLSRNPKHKEALFQTALLHIQSREYPKARQALQDLSYFQQDKLYKTHYFLAQIYRYENRLKKAEVHYLKARRLQPNFLPAVVELYSLYRKQGFKARATQLLENHQKTQGFDPQIQQILFQVYVEQGNWSQALAYLESISELHPKNEKIKVQLAWVWARTKNYKKALSILEKLTLKNQLKLSSSMYALYAGLLEETGNLSKALQVLSKAVALFPQDIDILFYHAFMYDRLGKMDQAIRGMKEVLKVNTQHVQALNHLAFIYAEQSKNLEVAEQMALKALSLKPKDSYILDTVGWVLFKRGKMKEAVKYLHLAHQNNTSEVVIVEHLAEVYYYLNRIDKSVGLYKKAISLETNESKKKQLEKKLLFVQLAT